MDWKQQAEEIERKLAEKAQQDPAFAELLKNDLQEAVKQATGLDLPFHLLGGLQAAEQGSGELSDDQLLEVAGGAATMELSQLGGGFSGIGTIGGSIGGTGGLSGSGISKDADASGSARDAATGQDAADIKNQLMQQQQQLMSQIIDFLKQLNESEVDAMKRITRL